MVHTVHDVEISEQASITMRTFQISIYLLFGILLRNIFIIAIEEGR
jgi:hypothetical protein